MLAPPGFTTPPLVPEAGYDGAKKTEGRKRFLLVDTLGHVLAVAVASADIPERAGARNLMEVGTGDVDQVYSVAGISWF